QRPQPAAPRPPRRRPAGGPAPVLAPPLAGRLLPPADRRGPCRRRLDVSVVDSGPAGPGSAAQHALPLPAGPPRAPLRQQPAAAPRRPGAARRLSEARAVRLGPAAEPPRPQPRQPRRRDARPARAHGDAPAGPAGLAPADGPLPGGHRDP